MVPAGTTGEVAADLRAAGRLPGRADRRARPRGRAARYWRPSCSSALRRRDEAGGRRRVRGAAGEHGVAVGPRPRRLVLTALLAALVLAVVSVPLAVGVAVGAATTWLPRRGSGRYVGRARSRAVLAAVSTFSTSSVVIPPEGADALVALAVGLACGHVLLVRERARGVPSRAWDSLRAMTSTPTGAPDGADDTDGSTRSVLLAVSREQLVVALIVVVQALWLGFVMLRGWYSAADLPNIAYANGRSLDWDYLTSTLGGHFGVAQRLGLLAPQQGGTARVVGHRPRPARVPGAHDRAALAPVPRPRRLRVPGCWIVLVLLCVERLPGAGDWRRSTAASASRSARRASSARCSRTCGTPRSVGWSTPPSSRSWSSSCSRSRRARLPTLVILPVLSHRLPADRARGERRVRGELDAVAGWLRPGRRARRSSRRLYLVGDYNSPSSEFTAPRRPLAGRDRRGSRSSARRSSVAHGSFYSFPDQWSAYADPPLVLVVLGQVALVGLDRPERATHGPGRAGRVGRSRCGPP